MDKIVKRESELSLHDGRRVAVRFRRNDQRVLATLLSLFGTIQVSPHRNDPQQLVAYGHWTGSLNELDAALKQISTIGLTLVGVVEEETDQPASVTPVQPWRVSVRLHMKNGPLFIYLTNLLASARIMSVPYSDQLWVEGMFRGSLDIFESSLRELKAEELIVLNRGEAPAQPSGEQVSTAPVAEQPVSVAALAVPASVLERPRQHQISTRVEKVTRRSKVVIGLFIVLGVASAGLIVARLESVTRLLTPHPVVTPAEIDPRAVSWSQLVHQGQFRSWISIQRQNGWSDGKMEEFLRMLRGLKTGYAQDPSLVGRSLGLLSSQNTRTLREFSVLSQSLRLRAANGWPFPDQPQHVPLSSFSGVSNNGVVGFYEALTQEPDKLGWLLEHLGRQSNR